MIRERFEPNWSVKFLVRASEVLRCAISESVCTKLLHRSDLLDIRIVRYIYFWPTKQKKEVMCKSILDLSKEFAGRRILATGGVPRHRRCHRAKTATGT